MRQIYELFLALGPACGILLGIIIFLRGVIAAGFILLWDIFVVAFERLRS